MSVDIMFRIFFFLNIDIGICLKSLEYRWKINDMDFNTAVKQIKYCDWEETRATLCDIVWSWPGIGELQYKNLVLVRI